MVPASLKLHEKREKKLAVLRKDREKAGKALTLVRDLTHKRRVIHISSDL